MRCGSRCRTHQRPSQCDGVASHTRPSSAGLVQDCGFYASHALPIFLDDARSACAAMVFLAPAHAYEASEAHRSHVYVRTISWIFVPADRQRLGIDNARRVAPLDDVPDHDLNARVAVDGVLLRRLPPAALPQHGGALHAH